MKIAPWTQQCGALANDVQLANAGSAEIEAMHDALAEYGVLFFRDQHLVPEDHIAFARRFGDVVLNKFFGVVDDQPEIAEVRKEADQMMNIGGGWHTDHSYDAEPALGSILVARELPDAGGDTQFANLHRAWAALPDKMKAQISGLTALHSNAHIYGKDGLYAKTDLGTFLKGAEDVGQAEQPVVIAHPRSGKPVLYVNPGHTIQIQGMEEKESRSLLMELYQHVMRDEFTCSFDWKPGSVAIWDNRMTWHLANNDYHGQRRLMHRITIAGGPLASFAAEGASAAV